MGGTPERGVARTVRPLRSKFIPPASCEASVTKLASTVWPAHTFQQHAKNWRQSEDKVNKGFAKTHALRSEMDAIFGAGNWISIERFMVRQASGKLRCIDNAKKRGQTTAYILYLQLSRP